MAPVPCSNMPQPTCLPGRAHQVVHRPGPGAGEPCVRHQSEPEVVVRRERGTCAQRHHGVVQLGGDGCIGMPRRQPEATVTVTERTPHPRAGVQLEPDKRGELRKLHSTPVPPPAVDLRVRTVAFTVSKRDAGKPALTCGVPADRRGGHLAVERHRSLCTPLNRVVAV